MSRGIFSDDFSDVFEFVLNDQFGSVFPSNSGYAPDPQGRASMPTILDIAPVDFVAEAFDLDLPATASEMAMDRAPKAGENSTLSATVADYGPLLAPGGSGGGGGKPDNGGGGGGGGKPGGNDSGGSSIHDEWVSGAAATSTDPMNIEVELYGDASFWDGALGTSLEGYLRAASEFISSIISQGFTDDPAMFHSYDTGTAIYVDDLLIEVYVEPFKGRNSSTIAAETGIFGANENNGGGLPETPAGATITFNANMLAGLDDLGVLDDTVLHEMLHALGFGLWETADNDLTSTSDGAITYTGDGATGNAVENEGLIGSVGGHWAEATYDKELMTSIVEITDDMYLEEYSILSLQDLAVVSESGATGYVLADGWELELANLNGTSESGGIDLDAWMTGA